MRSIPPLGGGALTARSFQRSAASPAARRVRLALLCKGFLVCSDHAGNDPNAFLRSFLRELSKE